MRIPGLVLSRNRAADEAAHVAEPETSTGQTDPADGTDGADAVGAEVTGELTGPWDVREVAGPVPGPGRHSATRRVRLSRCEFDIDERFTADVFLDMPDGDSGAGSVLFYADPSVGPNAGIGVRVLASPSKEDWWSTTMVDQLLDSLTGDVGGEGRVQKVVGDIGTELDVWDSGRRVSCILGASGRPGFAWTMVVSVFGDEVSNEMVRLARELLVSAVVNRPGDIAAPPGTPLGLKLVPAGGETVQPEKNRELEA